MPLTCPACNKSGQTGATCARCATDLSPLHRIIAAAESHLLAARASLVEGDRDTALELAAHSWDLRHTPDAARLAFLATAGGAHPHLDTLLLWHHRAHR